MSFSICASTDHQLSSQCPWQFVAAKLAKCLFPDETELSYFVHPHAGTVCENHAGEHLQNPSAPKSLRLPSALGQEALAFLRDLYDLSADELRFKDRLAVL